MTHQLKTLLGGNRELHPLLARAHELRALQQHLACVAPPYIAQCCQVLGLRQGTLSIAAANAAAAAKLRQLAPELATLLQRRGCEISGIRVKVQVSYDPGNPGRAARQLGKKAQNALSELSQSLPQNSALRLSLEKMIKSEC